MLFREQRLLTEVLGVMQTEIPMPILGLDTDNDSVFMNETVLGGALGKVRSLPAADRTSKTIRPGADERRGDPSSCRLPALSKASRLQPCWPNCMPRRDGS